MRRAAVLLALLALGACVAPGPTPSPTPPTTPTVGLPPLPTPEPTATRAATATPAPGFGMSEEAIIERINRNISAVERKLRLESETTLGDGTPRHVYGSSTTETLEVIGQPSYPNRVVIVANWPLELVRPPLTFLMIDAAIILLPTQSPEFVTWYNGSQGHASMTFRAGRRADRFIAPRGGVVIVTFEAP